jgi:hypothetical protein
VESVLHFSFLPDVKLTSDNTSSSKAEANQQPSNQHQNESRIRKETQKHVSFQKRVRKLTGVQPETRIEATSSSDIREHGLQQPRAVLTRNQQQLITASVVDHPRCLNRQEHTHAREKCRRKEEQKGQPANAIKNTGTSDSGEVKTKELTQSSTGLPCEL